MFNHQFIFQGIYKNKVVVDPTFDEETLCSSRTEDSENRGTVVLAYMKNLQQITEFAQNGSMDVNMFPEYVQILTDQNCKLYKMVISVIRKDVIEHFENTKS